MPSGSRNRYLKGLICGALLCLFSSARAESVCAKGYITLRKGPSADQPVSWRAAKYMPFVKSDYKGSWSKLEDLDGEVHWAKTSELTSKFRCIVVKTNVATLRQQPNPASPLAELRSVDRYTPFKRLENDRDWLQIEDESGRKAWIHESQVWKPVTIQSISF